jgi:hypothetical protein
VSDECGGIADGDLDRVFELAYRADPAGAPDDGQPLAEASTASGSATTRRVSTKGTIGFATVIYKAGAWLAGQSVEVVCHGGLVHIHHRRCARRYPCRRHPLDKQTAGVQRGRRSRPSRPSASSPSVTRKVDSSGNVCFAGANYRVGAKYKRRQVQVAVVGDTIEISVGNQLIRSHRVKHDLTHEHGALANLGGRPHRTNAA